MAGLALLGAAAALLVHALFESGTAAPLPSPPARMAAAGQWVAIERPRPLFALESPTFGKAPFRYQARRAVPGGGRRDTLTYGRFGAGAFLALSLYRIGSEPALEAPFFVALARRAAAAGLAITRSDQPAPLATRWGKFQTADVVVAQETRQEACLGFRLDPEAPSLRIAGLACGGGRPLERSPLACSLDRLALVSAGTHPVLGRFFKAAALRRAPGCGNFRPASHSSRKKPRN